VNRVATKRRFGQAGEPPNDGGRSAYQIILITDIENFTGQTRNDVIRAQLRALLRQLLIAALASASIEATRYTLRSTGDGWLAAIDPGVGKPRVVGLVVDQLASSLRRRNHRADPAGRLRVRLVVHAGDLLEDTDGELTGDQLNFAFRLLDANQLRKLLKHAEGPLVSCVSDVVYQVVAQRHEGLNPSAFEQVRLSCKGTRGSGWIRAPGEPGLVARVRLLRSLVGPSTRRGR